MQKICVFSPNRKFLHFLAVGFGGNFGKIVDWRPFGALFKVGVM